MGGMVLFTMAFCGAWYFLVPDHVDVFYNPWGLCALVTLVFMLSFLAGMPGADGGGYKNLLRYLGGAMIRTAGIMAVVFYPVICRREALDSTTALVVSTMCIYGFAMFLFLRSVYKNTGNG